MKTMEKQRCRRAARALLAAAAVAEGGACSGVETFVAPAARLALSQVAPARAERSYRQALGAETRQHPDLERGRGLGLLIASGGLVCAAARRPRSETQEKVARRASADGLDGPKISLVVFGATGYIGRAVVKELAERGHEVTAFTREKFGISSSDSASDVQATFAGFDNLKVVTGNVMDEASIASALGKLGKVDGAVCCLASRSGGRQDSFDIDYQATINCHKAVKDAGASQYVLLSAICVQKPLLAFQEAKLQAEAYIKETLVQPTAFFKSLLGQVKGVKGGSPYVMFGDGSVACKPISEDDLAAFIGDCFWDPAKKNATLPIGGPGKAMTFREQGILLHEQLGKEPNLISVPTALFDVINGLMDFVASLWPEKLSDIAEYGKIGKYYATECMLVLDKETGTYREDLTPSYGRTSLKDFLAEAMKEGSPLMESQKLGQQGLGSWLGVKLWEQGFVSRPGVEAE